MSYSKRLPQAGSGSHYMNLGGDLNFIGGLKEPLSLIDFIKGNKLRTLYKRIDYATEAVDKGKEAAEKLRESVKKYDDKSEADSIFQVVPSHFNIKNGDTIGFSGWKTITIPNPKKVKN